MLPCPHMNACPMPERDWCHFTKRLERSKMHRECKEETFEYEDEKFSYCGFSKNPFGPMHFRLCTPQGIEEKIVPRKDKEDYTRAKKLAWGDAL